MSSRPLGIRQLEQEQKKVKSGKTRQQKLSLAAGTLALGSAGLVAGAPVASRVLPKVAPHLKNTKGFRSISRKVMDNPKGVGAKVENYGYRVGTAGAAAGGLGSLNLAALSGREAKIQDTAMRKSLRGFHYVPLSEVAKAYKSVAVPKDTEAWRMAGNRNDNRWRSYVDGGAKAYDGPLRPSQREAAIYDRKARRSQNWATGLGIGSVAAVPTGVGAGYGAGWLSGKFKGLPKDDIVHLDPAGSGRAVGRTMGRVSRGKTAAALGGIGMGLAGLGALGGAVGMSLKADKQRATADRWDEAGRKIRARGFQRMLDGEPMKKSLGQLKPTTTPRTKRPPVNRTAGGYVDPPSKTSTPGMPNPAPLRRKVGV